MSLLQRSALKSQVLWNSAVESITRTDDSTLCRFKIAKVKGFDLRRETQGIMLQNAGSLEYSNWFARSQFIYSSLQARAPRPISKMQKGSVTAPVGGSPWHHPHSADGRWLKMKELWGKECFHSYFTRRPGAGVSVSVPFREQIVWLWSHCTVVYQKVGEARNVTVGCLRKAAKSK